MLMASNQREKVLCVSWNTNGREGNWPTIFDSIKQHLRKHVTIVACQELNYGNWLYVADYQQLPYEFPDVEEAEDGNFKAKEKDGNDRTMRKKGRDCFEHFYTNENNCLSVSNNAINSRRFFLRGISLIAVTFKLEDNTKVGAIGAYFHCGNRTEISPSKLVANLAATYTRLQYGDEDDDGAVHEPCDQVFILGDLNIKDVLRSTIPPSREAKFLKEFINFEGLVSLVDKNKPTNDNSYQIDYLLASPGARVIVASFDVSDISNSLQRFMSDHYCLSALVEPCREGREKDRSAKEAVTENLFLTSFNATLPN